MESQNFKNHTRIVPLFHIGMSLICLAILTIASINFFKDMNLLSTMFLLIAIALLLGFWYMRAFATKVQDRAIRAEENLRYFTMTGKLLDKKLAMPQTIALRFADDSEFVDLTDRAVKENLSNKEIKQAVQNWRVDHHRA